LLIESLKFCFFQENCSPFPWMRERCVFCEERPVGNSPFGRDPPSRYGNLASPSVCFWLCWTSYAKQRPCRAYLIQTQLREGSPPPLIPASQTRHFIHAVFENVLWEETGTIATPSADGPFSSHMSGTRIQFFPKQWRIRVSIPVRGPNVKPPWASSTFIWGVFWRPLLRRR